ncbi:hypothetical protein [Rhodoferax sp.]|uniref:hypothetical protein n=1 Tax=Rhodoferax sp. TaxID=50421 RepID=UPI002ACD6C54|nr:hypothetical protein [Rhodoferax sp.]MDZ7920413.1 hypothetical protein [Rhodoferax sp.]
MNDVYGIDPVAPSDPRDFAHLMRVFEVDQGRFIADFPSGGWFPEVKRHLGSLAALEQMKAIELWLRVGQSALVPASGRFNPSRTWPENATNLQGQVKTLIGASGCPATLTPLDQLLLDPNGFPDASGAHVPRTAEAYARVAEPLLQTSPKVVLVDPYFKLRYFDDRTRQFRPATRFRKSLQSLLHDAARWGRVEIFKLAVSPREAFVDDPDGDVFADQLEVLANECGVTAIKLEIQELDPSFSSDKHPRYLLGMQRGLHFDWGFDTGDAGSTNHVEWISKAALAPLLKRFT